MTEAAPEPSDSGSGAARVARELEVLTSPRQRANVAPGELDPRVGIWRFGPFGQPDDELCRIPLGPKQPVQHETSDEASGLPWADAEATRHGSAEQGRGQ